ncbi:MAG: polyketide synthase, partial [Planctomycetota bacterium]|nr:polyketide synthase [Planctomycetota bacterium]
ADGATPAVADSLVPSDVSGGRSSSSVVISTYHSHFPNERLGAGNDAMTRCAMDRGDVDDVDASGPELAGRFAAFLGDVTDFDAPLFAISSREAIAMDPQQRLLLESVGSVLSCLPDAKETGVYVGIAQHAYLSHLIKFMGSDMTVAYAATGNAHSVAAGRLSFTFGLQGASVAIDTACSASLVSLSLSRKAMEERAHVRAVAAGVNAPLESLATAAFSAAGMLSEDGRSKTLDAAANGYGRGEGVASILVESSPGLDPADGAPHGIRFCGSFVNHDGRSSALTAPSGPAQSAVILRALESGSLSASDVNMLQMHGTGTPLGDPIEVSAATGSLRPNGAEEVPLVLQAVKTELGHSEAAAGAASGVTLIRSLKF